MKHQPTSGYSILEVICVLALLMIPCVVLAPLVSWMQRQGIGHAVAALQAQLQLVRCTAIRSRQTCRIVFNDPAQTSYFSEPGAIRGNLNRYRGGVHFLSRGPDGRTMAKEVRFNSRGMSTSILPADIFIADDEGAKAYRIRVLLPGGIVVSLWNGSKWQ